MFRWIFFWRRQQMPEAEAEQEPQATSVSKPEPITMPEERRNEVNSRSRETRTLMVVRSNTVRALEAQQSAQEAEDAPEPKPVVVLPVGRGTTLPAPAVVPKPEEPGDSAIDRSNASDLPKSGRINYFKHGCYAVASHRGPRLTAPGLSLDMERGRSPGSSPNQSGAAGANLDGAQRMPVAEK